MKAYSEDLRKRVIESYEEGEEKGTIIKRALHEQAIIIQKYF